MKTAILLLYLAGVVESLSAWLELIIFFTITVVCAIVLTAAFFYNDLGLILGVPCFEHGEHERNVAIKLRKWVERALVLALVASLLLVVAPRKEIMLAMAGLSIGETAIQTSIGQKSIKVLETKLDELLLGVTKRR